MKEPKLIGLVCGWACEDFIEPALNQALEYCDETLVCISPHSKSMIDFADQSYDIAKTYVDKGIKLIDHNVVSYHAKAKSDILNKMISTSDLFDIDNWLWIIDIDEFYDKRSYKNIRKLIQSTDCDQFVVKERFFYINMKLYLEGEHNRLFRINALNNKFYPTQRWSGTKLVGIVPEDLVCMFHYGMLTNPHAKKAFWEEEYHDRKQFKKTNWIEKIYKNYDINDEDTWVQKNFELTGIYSPWFATDFKPDENGRLFRYKGKHPIFISKTELTKIKDFREYYGF